MARPHAIKRHGRYAAAIVHDCGSVQTLWPGHYRKHGGKLFETRERAIAAAQAHIDANAARNAAVRARHEKMKQA